VPAGRITMALAVCLGMALTLTACTDDDPPAPTPTHTGASANPSSSGQNSGWAATTAWQQVGNFDAIPGQPSQALIKLYPLQRVDGKLLLTADIVARGAAGTHVGIVNYFAQRPDVGDLSEVSLIDTAERVRYTPLRSGGASGSAYSSVIRLSTLPAGSTYRVGAFFPDPGPAVTTMAVDLQLAGVAPAVPIVDGTPTAPGLVTGAGTGATAASTTVSGTSAQTPSVETPSVETTGVPSPSGGDGNGPLTTWTVPEPGADAVTDRHDLIAKVVGGTVNEGGNRKQGVVSLNADVLFAFDSAELTGKAGSLVGEARNILSSKADPSKPVSVIGYTDSKGQPTYNESLSTRRAQAVTKALGKVGNLKISSKGRGEEEPVAPNSKADGSDNPKGRALNRRVEISYAPKPAPAPTTTAPPATTAPAPSGGASGAVTLPAVTVKSNGLNPAQMSATVQPVSVDGTLSLVTLDLTSPADTLVTDAFTGRSRASQDLGAFSIVDPATKRVYVPAYDADNYDRVASTYTHRLAAGQPQHLAFWTAALPGSLTSATVDLDQLGQAKGVPVTR
jgi:outer membrane protein OmpA-like peptidoglycan-associated protein